MPLVVDPAGYEIKMLRRSAAWHGKRVLEIGCGDGRLTLRLAAFGPARIQALDADPEKIRLARRSLPAARKQVVRYAVGNAEHLKFPDSSFDIVILSWAL